jgi:hypothetical protein
MVVTNAEIERLVLEIERYLALVALLRHEGYEPHWAPEPVQPAAAPCEVPVRAM